MICSESDRRDVVPKATHTFMNMKYSELPVAKLVVHQRAHETLVYKTKDAQKIWAFLYRTPTGRKAVINRTSSPSIDQSTHKAVNIWFTKII